MLPQLLLPFQQDSQSQNRSFFFKVQSVFHQFPQFIIFVQQAYPSFLSSLTYQKYTHMQQPQNQQPQQQPKKRYKSLYHLFLICINIAIGNFYTGNGLVSISTVQFDTIIEVYGINWDKNVAQGLYTGCIPIGASFGAIFTPFLLSKLSRKYILSKNRRNCMLATNLFAIFVGSMTYVENDIVFLIIRLLNGFNVGIYSSLVPVMIKEIAPVQVSGTLGGMVQFFIAFGVFFTYFFAFVVYKIVDNDSFLTWKIVCSLTLFTIAFQTIVLILIFPYETPKYLLLNDRDQEAKQLLALIYHEEFIEEVYYEKQLDLGKHFLMRRHKRRQAAKAQKEKKEKAQNNKIAPLMQEGSDNKVNKHHINQTLGKLETSEADLMSKQKSKKQPIFNQNKEEKNQEKADIIDSKKQEIKSEKQRVLDSFPAQQESPSKVNKPHKLLPIHVQTQFGQVTALSQTPIQGDQEILDIPEDENQRIDSNLAILVSFHLTSVVQLTGLNTVTAYGGQVAKEVFPATKEFFNAFLNFWQVLAAIAVTFLLVKYGRKTILQVGTFINTIILFIIAFGLFIRPESQMLGTITVIAGLTIYMANMTTTLAPLAYIFAAELVQAWVTPYAVLFSWVGAALMTFLFPIVKGALPDQNPAGIFVWFAVYSLLAFVFHHFYVIQTKDKTQKVIRQQYKEKPFCC